MGWRRIESERDRTTERSKRDALTEGAWSLRTPKPPSFLFFQVRKCRMIST